MHGRIEHYTVFSSSLSVTTATTINYNQNWKQPDKIYLHGQLDVFEPLTKPKLVCGLTRMKVIVL